jgi:hypothetical protein
MVFGCGCWMVLRETGLVVWFRLYDQCWAWEISGNILYPPSVVSGLGFLSINRASYGVSLVV